VKIFNEQHDMFRQAVRSFIEKEVEPHIEEWERAGQIPKSIWPRMGQLGFLGVEYDEKYGGGGADFLTTMVLCEEMARSRSGSLAMAVGVQTDMASPHLYWTGSEALKERYLPDICAGRSLCCIAVTEPGGGSDVAAIKTRAVRDGDHYVLNGSKMFITNGALADLYFVAARTESGAGSKGISMFIVEKGTPGFAVGRRLDKMGWRSSDTAELVFDGCRVPAQNLLGEEGRGFYAIMRNFQNERIAIAAMATGEAAKAIELTLAYVKTRKAFGAPLWDKQAIRQRLSMLAAKVEAGRQLVQHAAALDAAGRDCVKEVSMAKAYCAELLNDVVYDCLQFHGGAGYIRETAIERMYRDARVQSIGGGATEVMLEEVAKRL